MSRRSQVIQARRALENAPRPAMAQEQQLTVEQLVPMMMAQGLKTGLQIQVNESAKTIRFLSNCGPLKIPVDVDATKAREIAIGLLDSADKIDPQPEENLETITTQDQRSTQLLTAIEANPTPEQSIIQLATSA